MTSCATRPSSPVLPGFSRPALGGLCLLLLPLIAACGGVVAGDSEAGGEVSDAEHGGGDVDVSPDVNDVRPDDHASADTDAGDDATAEDAAEVPPECTSPDDCDDGEPCNGMETCAADRCVDGEPPAEGSACTTSDVEDGVCRGGLCALSSCGDSVIATGEECDDGNLLDGDGCESDCQFSCHGNIECNDGEDCTVDNCAAGAWGRRCVHEARADGATCTDGTPCTVEDRCTEGVCGGELRSCDDDNVCTVDSCDSTRPPTDPCIHVVLPDWYRDEDGDGWGDASSRLCAEGAPGDNWVNVAGDCCDGNVNVHPEQAVYFSAPYVCSGGSLHSFDYDCNGSPDRQYADVATGCVGYDCLSCSCTPGWCPGTWPDPTMSCMGVPTCGNAGSWVVSCSYSAGTTDGGTTESGTTDGGASDGTTPEGGSGDAYADSSSDTVRDDALVDGRDGGYSCLPTLELRTQACR